MTNEPLETQYRKLSIDGQATKLFAARASHVKFGEEFIIGARSEEALRHVWTCIGMGAPLNVPQCREVFLCNKGSLTEQPPAPEPKAKPEEWQVGDVLVHPTGTIAEYLGKSEVKWDFPAFSGRVISAGPKSIIGHPPGTVCDFAGHWTLRHRPTAEQKAQAARKAANEKLRQEWLDSGQAFTVQFWSKHREKWVDVSTPVWFDVDTYRRKPAPEFSPWSFDDDFRGLWVEHKRDRFKGPISSADSTSVLIGLAWVPFDELLLGWHQLDGKKSPCGKAKEDQ